VKKIITNKEKYEKKKQKKKEEEYKENKKRWRSVVLGSVFVVVLVVLILIAAAYRFYRFSTLSEESSAAKQPIEARAAQIYPNYTFEKGVVRIKVPLIPLGQVLSRKAGGWVITPAGSEFRSDYEVPIIIEYIDGRKFHREPRKPAWDQVRPANSIFRLYGKEGEYATVTIKRGVY